MSQSKEHVGDKPAHRKEPGWEELIESFKDDTPDGDIHRENEEKDNLRSSVAGGESPELNEHGPESESVPRKKSHKKEAAKAEKRSGGEDSVQKRPKRTSRKELLELIQRKNKILHAMEKAADTIRQDIKNRDDKILRMAAEFENYKKRTRREWELLQKKANADLIKELLGILDDFDRALESFADGEDHFHSGIRLIHSGLLEVLKRAGLEEIESKGRPFSPQFHEAMGEIETDETEEGFVAHVVQKGYMLNELLLRPARVIVAKKLEQS